MRPIARVAADCRLAASTVAFGSEPPGHPGDITGKRASGNFLSGRIDSFYLLSAANRRGSVPRNPQPESTCLKSRCSDRSENVVRVELKRGQLQTKGEERRRNSFGFVCLSLLLLSGLRRLRQDLVNWICRLQCRRYTLLSIRSTWTAHREPIAEQGGQKSLCEPVLPQRAEG